MTHFTPEALFELLPAVYRIRDAEQGGALRALIEVLGGQASVMENDIAQLYEDLFIETSSEWVVPYIGDLLGVRNLHVLGESTAFSQRARVANTLAFRRRKGTATMLEQLARDTTGWPARAVEFFELLATTQYVNHIRLHNHRAPDLRDTNQLELLNTAFDTIAQTPDVRRIASGRGLHNIPNMGLFLWRLQSYFMEESAARPVVLPPDGRYWFHPFGLDTPLFNRPQTETAITHLAEEQNVPGRLRRRPLYEELEAVRQTLAKGGAPTSVYFGMQPVFQLWTQDMPGDPWIEIPFEEIIICNLETWRLPAVSRAYIVLDESVDPPVSLSVPMPIAAAVDPVLGRLTLPVGITPNRVQVSYAYGFPGDVGGGRYNRRASLESALNREISWQKTVGNEGADFTTLTQALVDPASDGWTDQAAGSVGVIVIDDNASYEEDLAGAARIEIPEGSLLIIVSASVSTVGIEPNERRAHLNGNIEVVGTAPDASATPGTLVVDGLIIEGGITVLDGNLDTLRLAHSTVGLHDPDAPVGVTVAAGNPELKVELDHTLCGPVVAPETIREVRLLDSVVQAELVGGVRGPALAAAAGAPGPPVVIERCTVLGSVFVRELTYASESIFTEQIEAERLQTGCIRFSYVPEGSRTPRRYRCQPQLALQKRADELGLSSISNLPGNEHNRIVRRLVPAFTSLRYSDPAYTQLATTCAEVIRTGAEDGSEMGVWSFLKHSQRIENLKTSLDEYLRFGLEAGFIFAT